MRAKMCRLIFILIFMCLLHAHFCHALEVRFQTSYPSRRLASDEEESHLHKRDMQQFYDKATFKLDGLTRVASVPVSYPLDICILQLPSAKYATVLHKDKAGQRQFAVYGWHVDQYSLLLEQPAPLAVALDCLSFGSRGYVALTYNLSQPIGRASEGSPIYEISVETGIRTVQYFAALRLRAMYLRISSQELTLLMAHSAGNDSTPQRCPYFKWTGKTFQRLSAIPCSNARSLEAFGIDYTDYVAVANYADARGRTSTHSEIYKYNTGTRRFELFQRLRSNGAVDIKYFSVPQNEAIKRHFLVLGNTVGRGGSVDNAEADAVFYMFDKVQFVPYQKLSFYAVQSFLPVQHTVSEKFLLLVVCNKQDVKIYNLNDWKFEESSVQFTEGALSRGVARMRSYQEGEQSYLVIANELMASNETNIFQPLYKQDEHANALRQEIIDWARAQTTRLQQQPNIDHLLEAVQKLQQQPKDQGQLSNVHIKRVITKSLVDERLNLTGNYWEALQYAKRALDVIEHKAAAMTAAASGRSPRQVQRSREQHEFDEITVGTLVVREKVQARRINGVDSESPSYEAVNASKIYVSGEYKEASKIKLEKEMKPNIELNVGDLKLEGRLNGHNWTELREQTLKRSGQEVQFIKAPAKIGRLSAEAVLVNNQEVSGQPLNQLVSIAGGDYIVQQDVQFAQPLQVNRLMIQQRLNHIHVDRQRFDVLLKSSNETQQIVGAKYMDQLRVLEPIQVAGQMLGAELRAMSPLKVTHQSLQLNGDYVIHGDVIIGQLLSARDLVEAKSGRSAVETLRQAIRLDKPLQNVNLRFQQPLSANQAELSFLNEQDMQHLVKLNVKQVQLLQGEKRLPQSLKISKGFAEVKWLNGINVEQLDQQLLLRDGNQTITMPVQLGGLSLEQLEATRLQLLGKPLADYLNRRDDQRSNATLYVAQLQAEELSVEELHTEGAIYGQQLSDIYQLSQSRRESGPFQLPADFAGTLHAQNLWLGSHLNNVSVGDVEQQLQQLAGNIKYVGDFNFEQAMNISGLRFGGSFNGLSAEQFGSCWLELSGEQTFTAPQTLAGVESVQGLQLGQQARLNNYTLEQYIRDTYRLNGTEQMLQPVRFENPVLLQAPLTAQQVNGLRIPEDMIYAEAAASVLQAPLKVQGELRVAKLCNASSINDFDLLKLQQYLSGRDAATLHVESAEFEGKPSYETLNGRQLQRLLDEVWLANEHIKLGGKGQRVDIKAASFEGLLEFEGAINGLNVDYIKSNYFSRTRSQQNVNVALNFLHDVTFEQPLTASSVHLRGSNNADALVKGVGNDSLNFDAFVANTLKTSGAHTITGQWSMLEAHVPGDLHNVQVNQLNLVNDVLRTDTKGITVINGVKNVPRAIVKRLYATPSATVANVPIVQWMNEAAYTYGNHSIAGSTTLETVNLYNDLSVEGPVNGIYWQPEQLLLRDSEQHIAGALHVENTLPSEQRILTNNIAELWVNEINDLAVNELLANKARNRPNLHVENELIFSQPLTVNSYEVDDSYKRKRATTEAENWQQLAINLAHVQRRLTEPPQVLESFALRQRLSIGNVSHVETLSVAGEDVLAIWHADSDGFYHMDYFVWQATRRIFVAANTTLAAQLDIDRPDLKQLWQQLSAESSLISQPLLLATSRNCLAKMEGNGNDTKLAIYCLDKNNSNFQRQAVMERSDIKQLLLLDDDASLLALLAPHAVEFWSIANGTFQEQRRLPLLHAQQMALGSQNGRNYLAVLKTTLAGISMEIYSTGSHDLDYQLEQSIDFEADAQPRHLRYMKLDKSNDLLLCVATASLSKPLLIYQQRGAAGAEQIVAASVLPTAQSLHILKLAAAQQQFLALAANDGIYLLEPQLVGL